MIRLQKVMADRGVASRRAAEDLISEGRVRVDGTLITVLGTRVAEDARIEVDGRPVAGQAAHRYVLLNKPIGIVSTAQDELGRRTVVDHVGARERLYPVGRLDTDSEGLLLLTNDGAWAERVLHPRYGHDREYDVSVEGDLTDEALARLQRGIPLEEGIARAVRISVRSRSRSRSRLAMVLRTGWKRQVRRMCSAVGLKVTRLVRVRMGPLELGKLKPGEFRDLTKREIDALTIGTPAEPTPHATRLDSAPATAPRVTQRKVAPLRHAAPPAGGARPRVIARPLAGARPIAPRPIARRPIAAGTLARRPISPRVPTRDGVTYAAPRVTPGKSVWAARDGGRTATSRASAPRERRLNASAASRAGAPRVTRRAEFSRARVEGPRRQRYGERAVEAGRPTRERGPRAAAGPAARPTTRSATVPRARTKARTR
ncbi:MAG: pseudouridine synthase [Chloroflexota bacterium]